MYKKLLNMKTKILKLVTDHSSWWKKKKYRKESSEKLDACRKLGWKLKKKQKVFSKYDDIETRSFCEYYLFKK